MKNYVASNEHNLTLGEKICFTQQTVFNGEGKVIIGNGVMLGYSLAPHFYGFHELIQARTQDAVIKIGDNTRISNDIVLISFRKIEIGKDCLIGDRLTVYDCDGHDVNPMLRTKSVGKIKPVFIGDNVWIGSMVTILKGVTIGNNSIVAANSVVICDVPENSIVAGNPAKIINKIEGLNGKDLKIIFKSKAEELIKSGKIQEAKELIGNYKSADENDIDVLSLEAVIFVLEGNLVKAEEQIRRGLEIENENSELLFNLGYIYEIKEENLIALGYYEKALENCRNLDNRKEIEAKIEILDQSR